MSKLRLEIVDKDTADFASHLEDKVFEMLVHMLEDLGHNATAATKERYGYEYNEKEQCVKWRLSTVEPQKEVRILDAYKHDTSEKGFGLTYRVNKAGYTFCKLYDDDKLVALASGNFYQKENTFTILNFTVGREYRGRGYGDKLFAEIAGEERSYSHVSVILSKYAQASELKHAITKNAEKFGISADSVAEIRDYNIETGNLDTLKELILSKVPESVKTNPNKPIDLNAPGYSFYSNATKHYAKGAGSQKIPDVSLKYLTSKEPHPTTKDSVVFTANAELLRNEAKGPAPLLKLSQPQLTMEAAVQYTGK
jgi:GNAT superfamily N-acetyltransferase